MTSKPNKIEHDPDPFLLPSPPHHHKHNHNHNHHDNNPHHNSHRNNNHNHNHEDSLIHFPPSSPSSQTLIPFKINPDPHISSQFYTFNSESHTLMTTSLLHHRLPSAAEIRSVTPNHLLSSWRSVWKDRNEDTAFLTAWKRIQDKLTATLDHRGTPLLSFKSNSSLFVPHTSQWQHIVISSHSPSNLSPHLGLRDTINRIKQFWTVGAKFYGIPESFIRLCIASCPVCCASSSSFHNNHHLSRPKRRRFEYTESFDVPAKEVPTKLQQLAVKHKVVLCIRQKYIRYKPFMAEVKDYACHRAGEPNTNNNNNSSNKKLKVLKREPYASKRCGCGFRIRAIVPIANYNEKDKSFVYNEEGVAVFKLYAVHTGHEPGPLDGNARIMHRVVGHKGGAFLMDQETGYGVNEDLENDGCYEIEGDLHRSVLHQVNELRSEIGLLEGRIGKLPQEALESVSQELFDIVNKVRMLGDENSNSKSAPQPHSDVMLDLIEEDEDSFGQTLGEVAPWDEMRTEFDEKSILCCHDSKLTKPLTDDDNLDEDVGLVGIQVDSFYPDNPKWYDSPCGLDSGTDCGIDAL